MAANWRILCSELMTQDTRRARKSKATLVLDAVAQYLQDANAYQAVLASRKHRGRTITLAQVKQRLGLDA